MLPWRPITETATSLEVAGWKAPGSCQPRSLQQHHSPLIPWAGHGQTFTPRCSSYWKRLPTIAWKLSFLCKTVFSPHFCYLWLLTNYAVQTLQPWEEGQVSMAFCFWNSSLMKGVTPDSAFAEHSATDSSYGSLGLCVLISKYCTLGLHF